MEKINQKTQQPREPPGSQGNKKGRFIDSVQEEDESLKSVLEVERETNEARMTRRTTLHQKYSSEHKKSDMVPDSIDIRLLELNIYLKRPLEIEKNLLTLYHSDREILMEVVRKGSFRLTNYTSVFIQKAEILLTVMINLFVQFQKKVHKLQETFENLEDCLLPWVDIIKNIPIDITQFEHLEEIFENENDDQEQGEMSPVSKYEELVRHRGDSRIRSNSRNLTSLSLHNIGLAALANMEIGENSPEGSLKSPNSKLKNCNPEQIDTSPMFSLSTGSQEEPILTLTKHKSVQLQPINSVIFEDEAEQRKSSDVFSNSLASLTNLDNLESINSQADASGLEDSNQFMIKDRSGTGDSNLISKSRNNSNIEKEILDPSNDPPKSKKYCTKKDLFNLHNEIVTKNKSLLKKLKSRNDKLHKSIQNIVVEGGFKDNLDEIKKLSAEYSKVFSLICRNIKEGEDLFSNLNPRRSIFILESDICRQMRIFRQSLDEKLLEKFEAHSQAIQSIIHPHHEFVRLKMEEINHYGQNMYQEQWTAAPFTKGNFRETLEPINYFKIISPGYRRYMKKKLMLSRNSDVNNEDLVDFFKYFQMNYSVDSSFCAGWVSGKYTAQDGVKTMCILALDVS